VGEIEDRRIELSNQGYGSKKIATMLSYEFGHRVTRDMVAGRSKFVKNKTKNNFDNINIVIKDNLKQQTKTQLFEDEVYDLKDKYIISEQIKKEMKSIWNIFNTPTPKKILNLSDLHAPYINFEKLEIAINDNIDCDICVLNGDIFDGESMSPFDKMNEIDSSEEFNQVIKVLDVLSPRFKHVVWVGGNHDFQRFCRYILKNIKAGLRSYAFDRLNPIKYIADQYPNVITINHNTLEIGDVVFKHPNGYSGVEMKTVVNENDVLYANRHDLPNSNFRAVIIGHTHDGGEYVKNGIKLMETGCMCYTPDYRFTNPVKRRWTTGYARIELDKDNKIIFNKSHFIDLDN
jgi:predicted phosphodiesterase